MQPVPEGTPWWAYVLLSVLILFILPMYKVWMGQRKQEVHHKTTSARLARVDFQVSNEHNTNLREDIDGATSEASRAAEAAERAAAAAERAADVAERLAEQHKETRKDIGGLREESRQLAGRLDYSIQERSQQYRDLHKEIDEIRDLAEKKEHT